MPSSDGVIADAPGLSVKSRNNGFHEHMWPAIDQAPSPFPETAAQAAGIKRDLDPAIAIVGPAPLGSIVQPGGICLDPPGTLSVRMDSIGTAHKWPSGAAQDRRAWLEVIAFDKDGKDVFHRGLVPDELDPEDVIATEPDLFGLWDRTFKDDGTPAHFFWDVARVESQLLRPPVTLDKNSPAFDHSSTATFGVQDVFSQIDHITARVRIRPLSHAVLDDLVGSGDLEAATAGQLPTLDILGATSIWTFDTQGTGAAMFTHCNPR
jgi:hypothetical protein